MVSSNSLLNLLIVLTSGKIPGGKIPELYLTGHFWYVRLLIAKKPGMYGFMWRGWLETGEWSSLEA